MKPQGSKIPGILFHILIFSYFDYEDIFYLLKRKINTRYKNNKNVTFVKCVFVGGASDRGVKEDTWFAQCVEANFYEDIYNSTFKVILLKTFYIVKNISVIKILIYLCCGLSLHAVYLSPIKMITRKGL